ncbi:hypothetical protein A2U01_0026969, partial [Trifolium medium]|nr:hypothetical protein [Trifolium medium]
NMADFADELLKTAADQKGPKRGKKKVKSRAIVVLEQSGSGGSSSPGGVSSSQGGAPMGSPVVRQPPPKRQREEEIVIDFEAFKKPFLLPRVFSDEGFLEKHSPMVADVERFIVLDMGQAARQDQLVQDIADVMRLLETTLVLNDEQGSSTRDLEKLKAQNEKLEAEVLKLDGEAIDLRGK